ncbi:potassium-transporting ATPase subunit C [Aeromonas bivalvium]|uniref:potassium-transporting ATPase subunit C n=1 Tax=Aeromonas bivalvium TaxID=440079 RepID=UPI0038D117D6
MIAIRTLLTLTLLLGVGYPLAVTGLAQLIFPWQANGSQLVDKDNRPMGSALLAQRFERTDYFHSRPSASDFTTVGGGGSNLGVSAPQRHDFAGQQAGTARALSPSLLTRSGSGLDPHLPLDAVLSQVNRVAQARALDPARLTALVKSRVEAGILGPQVINILELNLALDKEKDA